MQERILSSIRLKTSLKLVGGVLAVGTALALFFGLISHVSAPRDVQVLPASTAAEIAANAAARQKIGRAHV